SRPPAMTTTVREALRLIAADPALGRKTFSDAAAMDGLLGDYLPDAPAEAAIIRAAVSAGVPGMLTTDLPPATSMPLAAARMFERTGYPLQTCQWAVREIAVAFGLAGPEPTDVASVHIPVAPVPPSAI